MPSLPRIKGTDNYSQQARKINDAFAFIEELSESTFTTVIPSAAQVMVIDDSGAIVNKSLGQHYSSVTPFQLTGEGLLTIPSDNKVVRSITITNSGSSYSSVPTATVADPYTTSAWSSLTTYSINNIVSVIGGDSKKRFYKATTTIASGGSAPSHTSGITSNWLLIGRTAVITATISSGQLNTITVDDTGFGYTTTPLISFTGGGGTGAQATPRMYSDIVFSLNTNSISNKVNITSLTDTLRSNDYILIFDETSQSLKKAALSIITPNVPTGGILFGSSTDSYTWDETELFWNNTTKRLGIGVITPSYKLDIAGTINLSTGNVYNINGVSVLSATTLGSSVINSSLTALGTVITGTWNASLVAGQYGGTGVNNAGKTITVSGNVVIGSSTHTVSLLTNANSSVTLPVSGTLSTLSGNETLTNKTIVASSNTISGITNSNLSGSAAISNANLANSNVTIGSTSISLGASTTSISGLTSISSTAFVGDLTGNATTATRLQTGRTITLTGDVSSGAVSFDGSGNITIGTTVISSTFPNIQYIKTMNSGSTSITVSSIIAPSDTGTNAYTVTVGLDATIAGNGLTFASGIINVIGTTNRILVNSDSIDISSLYVGQTSLTTLGTITTGVWNATIISPTFGGTGVNNASKTISLGGNISTANSLTTIGNFALTLTTTNTTNVTLPLNGTLVNTTGSGATGTWGISISGSAASATIASTATTATNLVGGSVVATTGSFSTQLSVAGGLSSGTIANPTGGLGALEIVGGGGSNAAFMSFHRFGVYAAYFGIDSDNIFKIGGYSMGGNSYALLHSGNYTSYSPSLSGIGATGNWGINITGTASLVTKIIPAGTSDNIVECTMGSNDFFRIRASGSANAGEIEFATADDGTEPIYFRQYTGIFTTVVRTLSLLDASGNSNFPGSVTAPSFIGSLSGNADSATNASYSISAGTAINALTLTNVSIPQNFRGNVTSNSITAAAGDIIDVVRVVSSSATVTLPTDPANGTCVIIINCSPTYVCSIVAGGSNLISASGSNSWNQPITTTKSYYFSNVGSGIWRVN